MGLYVGDTRVAPVLRVMPNFKGTYNLIDDLELTLDATETQIATALASAVNNPLRYDYCLVEKPWYQVYEGYASFTSVDDYINYYVIYNDAYVLIDDSNKSSSGITAGTTVAYILNNAYSVVRYNFDGTVWTSTDNSGYANVDASNFTDSGTTFLSGLGMPSNRYETLTVGASDSTYTAPANGWFYLMAATTTYWQIIANDGYRIHLRNANSSGGNLGGILPVLKDYVVTLNYTNISNTTFRFYYAEGTPTPPQP